MFSDKSFRVALAISLITHATLFFKLPHINFLPSRRALKQIEVTYIKEKSTQANIESYNQKLLQKASVSTSSKKTAPPPYIKKDQLFKETKNISISKPEFIKPEVIAVKKKITLPRLEDEKITNPVYLNYYQILREKIKRAAYQNYTHLVNGEVYLSFIILSNGQLKDIRINEEKSTTHTYLKDIAQKNIFESTPFPDFPKELSYPELSFNVIISFETE